MNARVSDWGNYSDARHDAILGWGKAVPSVFEETYKDYKLTTGSTHFQQTPDLFDARFGKLKRKIDDLEKTVLQLKNKIDSIGFEEIIIRNISYDEAKKEVAQYFKDHHGENIDAADIEESLGIEFSIATAICEELEKEGKIKEI